MGQHHSQLAHHILGMAPQLALSLLLVSNAPFRTSVPSHKPYSIVPSWSEQDGLWEDEL